jgi:hypothetical protein
MSTASTIAGMMREMPLAQTRRASTSAALRGRVSTPLARRRLPLSCSGSIITPRDAANSANCRLDVRERVAVAPLKTPPSSGSSRRIVGVTPTELDRSVATRLRIRRR